MMLYTDNQIWLSTGRAWATPTGFLQHILEVPDYNFSDEDRMIPCHVLTRDFFLTVFTGPETSLIWKTRNWRELYFSPISNFNNCYVNARTTCKISLSKMPPKIPIYSYIYE
jgi:hypothetical protein